MHPKAMRVYPLAMGTIMSFVMSGIITAINLGVRGSFPLDWMKAWAFVLPIAIVATYVAAPLGRRAANLIAAAIWGRGASAGS